MTTPHVREELSAWMAGELAESERLAVEQHLEQCADCRAEWDELKRLDRALDADHPLEPSPAFVQRVLAGADAERKIVRFRAGRVLLWTALAAAIVFAVFLLRATNHTLPQQGPLTKQQPTSKHQTPPEPPAVAKQNLPATQQNTAVAPAETLSAEDAELIAHLDELQDMDVIQNFDSLQDLDTALLASQSEQLQ